MNITIKDNKTEEVLEALKERIPVALEAIGLQAETRAKAKCPVDTGLLRNSITHAVAGHETASKSYHAKYGSNRNSKGTRVSATSKNAGSVNVGWYSGTIGSEDENAVYIGTNVDYAPYVEYGTSNQDPQPFLKPAVMDNINEYNRILKQYLSE